jgi:hypothetical protein
MSMHLHHPALSLNGKRKGKHKWASADAKKQHTELENLWQQNMKSWQSMSKPSIYKPKPNSAAALRPKVPPGRETKQAIPSLDTGHIGAVSSKPVQVYTGNKIIGIGTLHKSNAVPVFSDEEAKDMARMRRG